VNILAKNIVITGGSKGVGYHLARQFLSSGENNVIICSRNQDTINQALIKLRKCSSTNICDGIVADVSNYNDMMYLADYSKKKFGTIDIWINNAGSVAYQRKTIMDLSSEDIKEVVETNLLGSIYGCKAAIEIMKTQKTYGHIYNMDGAGVDGGPTDKFAAYGATKRGLPQFTKSLNKELRDLKISTVTIHNLSPGMVLTDLLLSESTPIVRKFFNALAEEPQTVAQDLAPRVLAVDNNIPVYIRYLTNTEALRRIVTGIPQILFGGRFFDKDGNRVKEPGAEYNDANVRIDL
jgi:chlorophyll(ide) b reductase